NARKVKADMTPWCSNSGIQESGSKEMYMSADRKHSDPCQRTWFKDKFTSHDKQDGHHFAERMRQLIGVEGSGVPIERALVYSNSGVKGTPVYWVTDNKGKGLYGLKQDEAENLMNNPKELEKLEKKLGQKGLTVGTGHTMQKLKSIAKENPEAYDMFYQLSTFGSTRGTAGLTPLDQGFDPTGVKTAIESGAPDKLLKNLFKNLGPEIRQSLLENFKDIDLKGLSATLTDQLEKITAGDLNPAKSGDFDELARALGDFGQVANVLEHAAEKMGNFSKEGKQMYTLADHTRNFGTKFKGGDIDKDTAMRNWDVFNKILKELKQINDKGK
ncbi:hypothetical protein KKI23_04030, partial [Patescibacteria group bacterium]|nr:hypothetical protein [Patescibacteria group bacterium]